MIVKVHLVTHSIIPNLNSRLVPINPIGLVTLFSLYLDFTAESVVQCQPAVINPLQTYLYLGSNLLGPSFFLGKFPWIKFYLDQFSVGSILLWVNFPLGRFALGQFTLDQISFGTKCIWVNLFWVKFLLDNDTLGQVSFGSISFGSIFCWVKLPFFGFKCPWVNLPWTQMLLGRISLVQCGLGQFTLGRTPWAKRLGPFYSAPFNTHLQLYFKPSMRNQFSSVNIFQIK